MLEVKKRLTYGAIIGAFIGFIGGLLGVGGGFIVAPVLMAMGYPTKKAAATTAFVVTFSSFSGYLGHANNSDLFNWLTALLVLAVVLGSQAGANFMAKKAKPKGVKQIYGIVLIFIAAKMIFDVVTK